MDILDKIIGILKEPMVLLVAGGVLEFVFRLIKTDKPLSIAHVIASGVRKVAALVEAVAGFLDKVLPQRLAEPPAPPAE